MRWLKMTSPAIAQVQAKGQYSLSESQFTPELYSYFIKARGNDGFQKNSFFATL
jgi:hypothetical protein